MMAILNWLFDRPYRLFGLIVGLVALMLWLHSSAKRECEDRGGEYVVDHYQTTVTMSGKTPIVTQSPVFRCKTPE